MESFFGSEFFAGNRAKLRKLFSGTAPIVITANGLLQRSADNTYPFQQDTNFWYLTGLDAQDLVLVLDKEKEYLIVPTYSDVKTMFDGPASHEALSERSGIATVLPSDVGWKQLATRIKKVKHVATIAAPPAYVAHYDFYTNPARAAVIDKLKEINPDIELLDLRQHLARMRVIKQPQELQAMQKAIDITCASLKKIERTLSTYSSEWAIEADITRDFILQKAIHAYSPVIAAGGGSATIHNFANKAPIKKGDMVLFDVGAEIEHYAADISRTYFTKPPTRRQAAIYSAVLEVQEFALARLKPGLLLHPYEEETRQFMGEKLRELGLIKTVDETSLRKYYPHLTSHFLGLDVHDSGDYDQPLQAGMVLTVEPGIYIADEGIGVRIEDDVLITEKGHEILTKKLSKSLR